MTLNNRTPITIAVGDIHGELDKLENLLFVIWTKFPNHQYLKKYVFLGDYVDRGPNSKGVIDRIRKVPNAIYLRGNHEQMMLDAIADPNEMNSAHWLSNGGLTTIKSFGETRYDVPMEYVNWLNQTDLYHWDHDRVFVHAGIQRSKRLEEQDPEYMMWARQEFFYDEVDDNRFVVHGHTPFRNGDMPEVCRNRINIDTGCGKGENGRLTAVIFHQSQVQPTHVCQDNGFFAEFNKSIWS